MTTPDPHVIDKLRDAVRSMEKCIKCTICLQHISVPVRTSCGHTFCDGCIKKTLTRKNAQCPLCNVKLNRRSISRDNRMTLYIEGIEKLKKAIQSDVGSDIFLQSTRAISTEGSHSPPIESQSNIFEMPGTSADVTGPGTNSLPKESAPRKSEGQNSIEGKSVFLPTPSKPATNAGRKRGRKRKSSNSRNRSRNSWSTLNVSRSLTRSLSPPKISPKTKNSATVATANACHNSPPVLIAEVKRSLNSSLIRSPGKLLENPAEIRKRVIASRQLFLDRAMGGEGTSIEKPSLESLKAVENLAAKKVERTDSSEGLSKDGGPPRVNESVEISDPAKLNLLSSERRPFARKNVATFLYMARTRPDVVAQESQTLRTKATQTVERDRTVQSTQTDNALGSSSMIRIPLESFELGLSPAKQQHLGGSDAVRGNESSRWPKTPPRTDSLPAPALRHESFARLSGSTKTVSGPASSRDNESFELEEFTKLTSCPKAAGSNDSFERFVSDKGDRPEKSPRLESIERRELPAVAERTLRNVSVLPTVECLDEDPPTAAVKQRRRSTTSSESKWSGASTVVIEADELPKKDYKRIIPGTESDSSGGPTVASVHKSNQSRSKRAFTGKRKRSSSEEEGEGKADSVNDVVTQWCQNSGSTQRSNKKTRPSSALSRKSNVLPDKPRALAALSDDSTNVDDIITNWCRDAHPIRRFIESDKSSSLARRNSGPLLKRGSSDVVNALKVATPLRDTSTMDSMASSLQSFVGRGRQEVAGKLGSGRSFARKSSDKANTSGLAHRDSSTMDVLCATQISVNRSRSEEEEEIRAKRTDIDPPLNPHKSPETYGDAMDRRIVSASRKSMSNAHPGQGSLEPSLNPHKSSDRIPGETSLATDSVRAMVGSFKKSESGDIRAEPGNSNSTLNSRKTSCNAVKPTIRETVRYMSTMDSACMTQDPFNRIRMAGFNKANVKSESAKVLGSSSEYKFMRASELENSRDTSPSDDLFDSGATSNTGKEGSRAAADRSNDDIIDRVRELQRNDTALKNTERPTAPAINSALDDNFDEIIANVNSADLVCDFLFSDSMHRDSDQTKVEPLKAQANSDDDRHVGSDDLGTLIVSLGGSCGSVPEPSRMENNRINQRVIQKPDDKLNKNIPKNIVPARVNTTLSSVKQEPIKNDQLQDARKEKLLEKKDNKDEKARDDSEYDSLMDVTQHQMLIQAFEEDLFGGLPWSPLKSGEKTASGLKDGDEQPEQRTPQHRRKDIKKAGAQNKDAEHSAGEDDIVESTPETKVKNSRSSSRSRTPTPAKKFLNMSQSTPLSKQLHKLTSNATLVGSAVKPLQHSTPKVLPKDRNETPSSSRGSPVLKTNRLPFESTSALRQGRVVQRKVSVVCSSLTPPQIERVKAFTRAFGGTFKSLFDEGVTHVIVKTEGKTNSAQKTLKYLQGVAHGKWVVSYEWVIESMTKGRLVDEEPYEVVESPNLEEGPRMSRLGQRNLFSNFAFMLCGPYVDVSVKQIQDMLLCNGATVLETPVDLAAEKKKLKVVALCEESSTEQDSIEGWSRHARAAIVSHVWIIECISRYRVVSLYPYLLRLEPEDVLAFGFSPQLLEDDEEIDSE